MPSSLFITVNRFLTPPSFLFHGLIISLLFILCYGAQTEAADSAKVTKIGAIFNTSSHIGKEKKVAMEIAAQNFNKDSTNHKLSLYFEDSGSGPLKATSSAEKLNRERKVDVIVGLDIWQEATLVAQVGKEAHIPVISFAAPSMTPPLMTKRWPFLIAIDYDASAQINCIADLVCAYNWQKVVVIYEDNGYGGASGTLNLLNQVLQAAGAEMEYSLVLPPYSFLSDPKEFVIDELLKVSNNIQSRVFIVLQSSFPMVAHLFREAKKIGLVGRDSVWIITESITSLLDSVDSSVISSMKGILGIKTYYSQSSNSYKDFHTNFNQTFQSQNPPEYNFKPGIHALRAYDSITTITQGINGTKTLFENILSSNFSGLSGRVSFKEGKLWPSPIFRIINVIGKGDKEVGQRKTRYKELDFWMPEYGFLKSVVKNNDHKIENRSEAVCKTIQGLKGNIVWPGNLNHRPKGWAMPTPQKPLRIGVPGRTIFKKFVSVNESKRDTNDGYDGFCIQMFEEVLRRMDYDIPYEFVAFDGSYPDLVDRVYDKTFDAVVGDVTILANRTEYVDFTLPYAESGLSLIVPIKSKESAWVFMKPFTWEMWVVTGSILMYTMFIVWFLEHPINPEFSGTLKNQIGITLWFTFSSLFFAHKERIHSNLTRAAVMVWLFVVFILSSSYTASLSSMLTAKQLQPVKDIEWLKRTNQTVGCDGDSFVITYLIEVLGFKEQNIYKVRDEYSYVSDFEEKKISAAFLELPYEKVFLNKYCKRFTTTTATHRFGGLGFVFQKGSPMVRDVSRAILEMSEDGNLTKLERDWLTPDNEHCSEGIMSKENESLRLGSLWGIYVLSGAVSTICFLLSLIRLLSNYKQHHNQSPNSNKSVWEKAVRLATYLYNGDQPSSPVDMVSSSSRWESVSTFDVPDHIEASPQPLPEIEISSFSLS